VLLNTGGELSIFRHIFGRKASAEVTSKTGKPPVFENLEPRILLSADSLLSCLNTTGHIRDPLSNEVQQVIEYEYTDASETNISEVQISQVEQEVSPDSNLPLVSVSDTSTQPLSLTLDDSNISSQSAEKLANISQNFNTKNVGLIDTNNELATETNASAENKNNIIGTAVDVDITANKSIESHSAFIADDGSMPIINNDADLSLGYETSIEIRGPPVSTVEPLISSETNTYVSSDEIAESSNLDCTISLQAPELPGLQLVDPNISSWNGQIIYLDFDGAEDVIYNGPVTVGPFDVPAFDAPGELAGQEDLIISQILAELKQTFAGTGIIFTIDQPEAGLQYSTLYIGGDDSAFSQYGSFLGLAEQVDVGNFDQNDNGLAFSGRVASKLTENNYETLTGLVGHEVGHLLGYQHQDSQWDESQFSGVAADVIIFQDGFEGVFPGSWVIGNNNSNTVAKWGDNNAKAATGSWSAFCADNGSNSRITYDNSLNTYMQRQGISLVGYATATLTFKYWQNTETNYDGFEVNIKKQDGNWVNKLAQYSPGTSNGWQTKTLNMNEFCGQSNLIIGFDFVSDGSIVPSGDAGVWIDDVSLVAQALPDLRGWDCYAPTSAYWGNTITVQGSVYNQASGSAGTFTQKFYLSADTTWGDADDYYLGSYSHGSLAGNTFGSDFNVNLTLPGGPPNSEYLTRGTYYIGMKTDANGNVTESDETNNGPGYYSKDFDWDDIVLGPKGNVELTLYRISDTSGTANTNNPGVAKSTFSKGETVRVTLSGNNTGLSVPIRAVLNLRAPDDSTWAYDSHTVGQDNSTDSPLNNGETDYYSFNWTIPADAQPGAYDILASIRDYTYWDLVYDTTMPGRNNDFGSGDILLNQFTVLPSPPDLTGWDCYVSSGTLDWGQSFHVQGQVRNTRDTAVSTDFWEYFYLSNDTTFGDTDDILLGSYEHTADVPAHGYGPDFTKSMSLPFYAPSGYAATGTFYIGMKTDALNAIVEYDETNNFGNVGEHYDWDRFSITTDAWTVFVFMDANDTVVAGSAPGDINELEAASIGYSVDFLVQVDYSGTNDTSRGRIVHDTNSGNVTSPFVLLGERDMGLPATITEFLDWGKANFPASNYGLIMYDHGAGFPGFGTEHLDINEIRQGIANSSVDLALLGFMACLMGQTEAAYEFRNVCDVYVASENNIPVTLLFGDNASWPFTDIANALNANPSMDATALGRTIVEKYGNLWSWFTNTAGTASASLMSTIGSLATRLDAFAGSVLTAGSNVVLDALRTARDSAHEYYNDYRDLRQYVVAVAADTGLPQAIIDAAIEVRNAFDTVVYKNWHSAWESGEGLSIYLPTFGGAMDGEYDNDLAFVADTHWEDFLWVMTSDFSDLRGLDCYAPSSASWGETINVQGQVYNEDDGSAGDYRGFTQKFYLSADRTWGDADDYYLGSYQHDSFPGNTAGPDFNVNLTLPGGPPNSEYLTRGTYYIGMKTDANENVYESDETNNGPGYYAETYDWDTIVLGPKGNVELTLYRISDTSGTANTSNPGVAKSLFSKGQTVRITLKADNTGLSVPIKTVLNIRAPDNSTWVYDSHTVGQDNSTDSPLANGETDYYSFNWTIPSDATVGAYDILASIRDYTYWDLVYDTTLAGRNNDFGPSDRIEDQFMLVANTTPIISGLPDRSLNEDTSLNNTIDLWAYTVDNETPDSSLIFDIIGDSNLGSNPTIDGNRYIDINPDPNWYGISNITVQVSDGYLTDTDMFTITVNSVNDAPIITALSDNPDPIIRGEILTLTANGVSDIDGFVSMVEFYRDVNGNSVLDVGTDTLLGSSTGGWSLPVYTGGFPLGINRYFARAQDNNGLWGNVVSTTGIINNAVPTAVIDQITPNPAQPPSQNVYFYGTGQDQDGSIVMKEWRSDLDGLLGTNGDWNISSYNLTVGQHQISFHVRDNDGQWSNWATQMLTIQNALPTAQMSGVPAEPVAPKSLMTLNLNGYDNDEVGQSIVAGRLLLNGDQIAASPPGSYQFAAPAMPGNYTLSYSVQDDEGSWSDPVMSLLSVEVTWAPYVPTPEQTELTIVTTEAGTIANVIITFPDSGYRIEDWGSVQQDSSTFRADSEPERFTGISEPVIKTLSNQYDLGILPRGNYVFEFFAWGQPVESQEFAIDYNITLYVDDDAQNDPLVGDPSVSDPNEDGSINHPFDAIQEAINAAWNGDTVIVLGGIYYGTGNRDIDFYGKAITVRSENGTENCIIDCQGTVSEQHRAFNFHNGEGANSVLQGLTITNGYEDTWGGGINCSGSSPTISNCIFTANVAGIVGGGIRNHLSSPTVTNCLFYGNIAFQAGGIFNDFGSAPVVYNCKFVQNYASYGGATSHSLSSPTLSNCLFQDNSATVEGGAMAGATNNTLITNCTFVSNSAPRGGGIIVYANNPSVTNCVFWGNSDDGGIDASAQIHVVGGNPLVTYSMVQGGWNGEGNIDSNPLFLDSGSYDYHLSPKSPCINAGNNSAVPVGIITDLDGNPRISYGVVDIGAYEWISSIVVEVEVQESVGVFEGDSRGANTAIFGAMLSWNNPSAQPVTIEYNYRTIDNTASQGDEFSPVDVHGSVTIPAGESGHLSLNIPVSIIGDTDGEEPDRTFFLEVTVSLYGTPIASDSGECWILDDDWPLTINDVSITEGNSGTKEVTFEVVLDRPSVYGVTYDYTTVDGTAIAGRDYIATSGTVAFSRGETYNTITVAIIGDTDYENDEVFYLHLSYTYPEGVRNEWAKVTIVNDDSVSLVVQSYPYTQDFESGKPGLAGGWEYYTTNSGRIEVTGGRLRMDSATDGTFSLNEAILHINLTGQTNVTLMLNQNNISDDIQTMPASFTGHNKSDGIAVSIDGTNWLKVDGLSGSHITVALDLVSLFGAGANLSNVRIKFQQYDNRPAPDDGREFDNIRVTSLPSVNIEWVTIDDPGFSGHNEGFHGYTSYI
jgi:hypothetical protein